MENLSFSATFRKTKRRLLASGLMHGRLRQGIKLKNSDTRVSKKHGTDLRTGCEEDSEILQGLTGVSHPKTVIKNWRKWPLIQMLREQYKTQFSHSVLSNSLRPHGLQHARFPCPSPTPRAYSVMSIESVMPSNHLILCCPLLLLPSIFPRMRVFSYESVLHIRWPKYWSFSFSISPSSEYSVLISFRIDWFDLLAVQGTFKSLLQHHSWKPSILQCSDFFIVQLSHPCMTTGKTIALRLDGPLLAK